VAAFAERAGVWRQSTQTMAYWLARMRVDRFAGALLSRGRCADVLTSQLDHRALHQGLQGWVEKTPLHCLCVNPIRELASPDGFIFVVRKGRDNAASLRDRAAKYPQLYDHQSDPRFTALLWNDALHAASE